jgi:deazaflavin-dependent oxidoreductase (nitroreductase family)
MEELGEQPQESLGPGVDMSVLPDAAWMRNQNQELESWISRARRRISPSMSTKRRDESSWSRSAAQKSSQPRRIPLTPGEGDGCYAVVASKGGSAKAPAWYFNLKANPDVQVQDLRVVGSFSARELGGEERALWWDRAVRDYPPFASYAEKVGRLIPVLVLEPATRD